jgi:hypothetical protein
VGLVIGLSQVSGAYSVLTHESVVDLLWKNGIRPLLKKRFPPATDEDPSASGESAGLQDG